MFMSVSRVSDSGSRVSVNFLGECSKTREKVKDFAKGVFSQSSPLNCAKTFIDRGVEVLDAVSQISCSEEEVFFLMDDVFRKLKEEKQNELRKDRLKSFKDLRKIRKELESLKERLFSVKDEQKKIQVEGRKGIARRQQLELLIKKKNAGELYWQVLIYCENKKLQKCGGVPLDKFEGIEQELEGLKEKLDQMEIDYFTLDESEKEISSQIEKSRNERTRINERIDQIEGELENWNQKYSSISPHLEGIAKKFKEAQLKTRRSSPTAVSDPRWGSALLGPSEEAIRVFNKLENWLFESIEMRNKELQEMYNLRRKQQKPKIFSQDEVNKRYRDMDYRIKIKLDIVKRYGETHPEAKLMRQEIQRFFARTCEDIGNDFHRIHETIGAIRSFR